jgi:hypothetical protein
MAILRPVFTIGVKINLNTLLIRRAKANPSFNISGLRTRKYITDPSMAPRAEKIRSWPSWTVIANHTTSAAAKIQYRRSKSDSTMFALVFPRITLNISYKKPNTTPRAAEKTNSSV